MRAFGIQRRRRVIPANIAAGLTNVCLRVWSVMDFRTVRMTKTKTRSSAVTTLANIRRRFFFSFFATPYVDYIHGYPMTWGSIGNAGYLLKPMRSCGHPHRHRVNVGYP